MHAAGISVSGLTVSEAGLPVEALDDHVVLWPGEGPPPIADEKIAKAVGRKGGR